MESWKGLLISLFLLLVVGAACGGGGEAPYSPQSANYATEVPACQALNSFDRYRYVYTFRWFSPEPETVPEDADIGSPPFSLLPQAPTFELSQTYEGAIINPDRIDIIQKTEDLGEVMLRWVEGQVWANLGDSWVPVDSRPVSFPPAQVCDAVIDGLDLSAATPSDEMVGELKTDHYRLEQVPLQTATKLWTGSDPARLLSTFDVDVWLTEDGWPARLGVESRAQYPSGRDFFAELSLEISEVNSGDISIEPPTG